MIKSLADITEVRKAPLHASGIEDYETCPRKFLFRHRAGLVPAGDDNKSGARRGTFLHAYIADVLRGHPGEDVISRLAQEAETAIRGSVGPSGYIPGGATLDEALADLREDRVVALAMARAYCQFFAVVPGRIGNLTVAAVEIPVSVPGAVAGTIDAIAQAENGDYWIVDHKTTSWSPKTFADTASLIPQTILYPQLLEESGFHGKVAGIIYQIIQTPTIRKDLETRVFQWYEDNPDALLLTSVRPGVEHRTLHNERIRAALKASISLPVIKNFPATGGSACRKFNSTCPYLSLCTSDTVTWTSTINQCYTREWRD